VQGKLKSIARCSIALALFITGLVISQFIRPEASAKNSNLIKLDRPTSFFYNVKVAVSSIKVIPSSRDENVSSNIDAFLKMNAQLEQVHQFSIAFGVKINDLISDNEVLNGQQLDILKKLMATYHLTSRRMLEFTSIYSMERHKNRKQLTLGNTARMKKNLLWLATNIALYDNFADGHRSYFSDGKVRRILKDVFKTELMRSSKVLELQAMIAHVLARGNRKWLRSIITNFKRDIKDIEMFAQYDSEIAALYKFIIQNKSTQNIYDKSEPPFRTYELIDNVVSFFGGVTNIISKFFGNSVGAIRWRGGFLYNDVAITNKFYKILKPLDIVLEKTPFALTDKFIPGNFGHAALYLGTETQLKEIRMWNHPSIKPYQEQIRKGFTIIEAVRPGVRLTTLEHFLQVDEMLVMRHKTILKDNEEVEDTYTRAIDQLGKEYDFNFDVSTTTKIVCSELLFMAFGKVNWPIEYIMGRPTISPDNLAELMMYENSPIELKNYTVSYSKKDIVELDERELAPKIGYRVSKTNNTNDKYSFDKELTSCKTIIKRSLRMGSRRRKYRKIRVCKKKFKHHVYDSSPGNRHIVY